MYEQEQEQDMMVFDISSLYAHPYNQLVVGFNDFRGIENTSQLFSYK